MAARTLRTKHSDEIRSKIQASVLVDFLTKHVKGERDMSATQVRSAEILLRKSVPDLSSIELSSDPDNPVQVVQTIRLVDMDKG